MAKSIAPSFPSNDWKEFRVSELRAGRARIAAAFRRVQKTAYLNNEVRLDYS